MQKLDGSNLLRLGHRLILSALFIAVSAWAMLSTQTAEARGDSEREAQVKSAFIYNFFKFVKWEAPREGSEDELALCIMGSDDVADALPSLEGKIAVGRTIRVRQIVDLDAADRCDALYISRSKEDNLDELIGKLRGGGALTISDAADFTGLGGMINFIRKDNKVRFAINVDEAKRSGIRISSKLLKLADIVETSR